MRKFRTIWLLIIVTALMASGFYYYSKRSSEHLIRISSNPWVGFTPFIYAQEKGWLEKTPFRFMWLVDLSENSRLYERGFTQGFTATQYEMLHFKDSSHIKPVFLIDRSNGADAILSNRSLAQLRKVTEPVPVYLELGSLNEDLFQAFVKENHLEKLHFSLTDSSQKAIMQLSSDGPPVMVISYAPYATELAKHGFLTVASTATLESIFVIDALFMDERSLVGREGDFKKLRDIFNQAQNHLRANPHEFYGVIRSYLEGQSYEEFMGSTRQIEWLNQGDTTPFLRQLQKQAIQTDRLLP